MDDKALRNLSYGLFVLTAKEGDKDNGCIINTVTQVANTPDRISIAVRFAAAKYLSEEALPLVIDGTGEMKNDESRKALIDYLVRMEEEQIIILTDDMRLPEFFMNSGVQANVIEL